MTASDTVIKVENLSKQYRLGLIGTGTISHDLNRWWALIRGKEDPYLKIGDVNVRGKLGVSDYVWALKDINFEVKRGEVLGIIGKNGAGKSTLLKILSRVTGPTTGSLKVKGRIASLLEVGTGFHPELTGKENIILNGAILGMNKAEIVGKLDEIIDFSGVERYIDTPVKRYSSGMYVRLAFAVAAHLEPEILIIDEVLAVGDAEFQTKCLGKMKDVAGQGRTILFVSHNMGAVKKLCSRSILLINGGISREGNTHDVINAYLDSGSEALARTEINEDQIEKIIDGKVNKTFPTIKVIKISIENVKGVLCNQFRTSEQVNINIQVNVFQRLNNLRIICELVDKDNTSLILSQVSDSSEYVEYVEANKISQGEHEFTCIIPPNILAERRYYVSIQIVNEKTEHLILEKALYFDTQFIGYNDTHYGSHGKGSIIRPLFDWNFS